MSYVDAGSPIGAEHSLCPLIFNIASSSGKVSWMGV